MPLIPPYIIKIVGKIKIAVLGLASSLFGAGEQDVNIDVTDTVRSLRKYLPELKQKFDIIVLM